MARGTGGPRAALVLLIVAAVALGAGWWSGTQSLADRATGAPTRPADAFALTVASVWDGDTLRATLDRPNAVVESAGELKVRLIGIDTPERSPVEECGALDARDALLALAPVGSTVWAAPDADPRDRYDRWLFYLWTDDGRFINERLTASGDAEPLSFEPNTTYAGLLAASARGAREAGLGQWGACD
ncbi:thermonuclease family protein [Microbacterium terricola]|uniref:TNase-like domain-containing protein n=1 Tax=Microbacterium terricola TaxID=344163 RepID=A0ABM8DVE6_9MICO|nr:thermonuclease family protein [Microbacterium terricola]UYK39615.1 thermonuclease family protein [Microbacterium terricola]BDV29644.1 hypothetical protein Microterr_03040 [Microbacterium terricola]